MPGTETLKQEMGLIMGRIARGWRVKMDGRLARLGLTQAKWMTLYHLALSEEPVIQRDLAALVGVEGPTLVRLLDGLEKMGLVAREAAQHDRRGKVVRLTEAAQPVVSEMCSVAQCLRDEAFKDISQQDLATCLAVLRHVQGNLDAA